MRFNRYHIEWLSLVFFLALVGIVFQQINTNLVEQGIASGDPFHNAAFYPQAVAILIVVVVVARAILLTIEIKQAEQTVESKSLSQLWRPIQLTCIFALYLLLLGTLGYHLTTAPFIMLVMYISGDRNPVVTILFSLFVAFSIAFLFEKYLSIVLPGGMFSLNIPW